MHLFEELTNLKPDELKKIIDGMSQVEALAILYDWEIWAREKQLPPDDWGFIWLILAGRGFGKTRTGAETVRKLVETGQVERVALVAPTAGDARDVMVEGKSGILSVSRPDFMPDYQPSKRKLEWPNGAVAFTYSAEEPERLRGPEHDFAWCDELAAWKYPADTWDMLMFGLRLGANPRVIVTTTPKPIPLIRKIVGDPATHITRGSTYENEANLAPSFMQQVREKYEGTRLGRQELYAEILDDVPGALWNRGMLEELRVKEAPELTRVVVAIDPAVSSGENSDETGIIVAGIGVDGHGYILDDRTCRDTPRGWARRAINAYREYMAQRVVAEVNQGGDMVEHTLRMVDPNVPYKAVRASRGKRTRAEPVAALYEQGRVHHVGSLAQLEDQMCLFTPDNQFNESPDRVDALVWALTELIVEPQEAQMRLIEWDDDDDD